MTGQRKKELLDALLFLAKIALEEQRTDIAGMAVKHAAELLEEVAADL